MRDLKGPKLSKAPFFIGDALLLGAAGFIYGQSKPPMGLWEMALVVACVAGGAALAIVPFLLEYRALAKLAETESLTSVVSQLQNLKDLAAQISGATSQWQAIQEQAGKTAAVAKAIEERITAEARAFTQFMERANDSEKNTLRLEVEKLRRAENDWLQVLVRVLDHVYALHQGALRSGQPNLIEQLGQFQNACRDAARRVGLAPFNAGTSEPFNAQRHQLIEADGPPANGARITETVAAGYTFQGRLLRPALVRLGEERPGASSAAAAVEAETVPQPDQSQLPLEPAGATPI